MFVWKFFHRWKTLYLVLFPYLLQELFQCSSKEKLDQNILEEDMGIWLTSVQELTPVTWNISPDTTAVRKSLNWVFSLLSFVCLVFIEGMWNGVQVNPPTLLPRTHSCRFENFLKYFLKDRGKADVLCFPSVLFLYLPRIKQFCLHLMDQCTNATLAVINVIIKHAMTSDYYLLGSQYVTQWFYFRVPVYDLKAGCAWAILFLVLSGWNFEAYTEIKTNRGTYA